MNRIKLSLLLPFLGICICVSYSLVNLKAKTAPRSYLYRFNDPSLSVSVRVNDLVSRLTLEEKVAQMLHVAPAIPRLAIPAYTWWNECLHGVARTSYHVTVYPQAIAMAATFDRDALHTMADYTAEEGRAINNESIRHNDRGIYLGLTYWTPNINIFRDPRWGRGQETYGEDPYLTAHLGDAFVTGLQGSDKKYLKAAACAKHYAIHSGPESSRHEFDAEISDYDLWDTYLPAFKQLVVKSKVAGVMCAYNAFKGQPCCGNDLLMTNILRNQWNFTGYVTSDCWAINDFYEHHKTSKDAESAASDAVLHGTDLECGNVSYKTLVAAVKDRKLTENQLDISLRRLFTIRFRLGMFDPAEMVPYSAITTSILESPRHHAQALKMARESIVLLKNENNLLPLSKNLRKLAVVGPNANNLLSQLGNYNGKPSKLITALAGIQAAVSPQTDVIYLKGVDFVGKGDNSEDFKSSIDSLKDADAIIFVGGISPQLEGEEMKVSSAGFSGGDRTTIALPEIQTRFLKALKATGKPVVFAFMTGSALAINWEAGNIPAIVNCWYGGQDAGTALADVLFGEYNPSGKLPVTFYKSDADLPSFTDYSMTNRTYRYFTGQPLYGFGYGKSYTTFSYSGLKMPESLKTGQPLSVSITVKNTGKVSGDEVSELYIAHLGLKIRTPIKALKGFERTFLHAGESKVIHFTLIADDLNQTLKDGSKKFLPGKMALSIGSSQADRDSELQKSTIIKTIQLI